MELIKSVLRAALDIFYLVAGGIRYLFSGVTPHFSHHAMVNLFAKTGGYSNSILSRIVSIIHPPYHILNDINGVLGNFTNEKIKMISSRIEMEGYYVFENKLPPDLCDRLLQFALTTRCHVRALSDEKKEEREKKEKMVVIYDRNNPRGVRYDFEEAVLINNMDVQKLFTDASILSIAQAYLNSSPIIDVTGMWWHTAYQKTPDKEAAQFYHFDMDRIKWIKFFFYLTEVSVNNGPHCFVARSHRNRGIPAELLKHGYARLTDEQVEKLYKTEDFIEFTGGRGTVIAEDTRGLHKGKTVYEDDRLILQIQFSNSLFGATYKKSEFLNIKDKKLIEHIKRCKRTYSNYL